MEYKFTINLPKTNFAMKANLAHNEKILLNKWKNKNYFYNLKKKKIFILNDGPPYANGNIHIGHAFNKILKDFVCKFKFLCGYQINFIPGWDCHGLPIELNIEKKTNNKDSNFRNLCKNYAESQIIIQMNSFIRLGIFANWAKSYKTLEKIFITSVLNNFIKMFKKKYIYLGYKPNHWCFDCKSALAESEIEYYEKTSDSVYFFLECINYKNIFNLKKIGFIVWTTTPWTIPFNEALALNEKFNYSLIEYNSIGYIINSELINYISNKLNFKKIKILENLNKKILKKIKTKHPIYDKKINIIFSSHVKNDSGTGCVHIAPAYGYDDYKCALKYKLQIINNIDEEGFFYDSVKFFEKIYYLKANDIIINHLKSNNKIILNEKITHRYPYCWRHKTPLIFRTTKQWFLNITNKILKNKIYYLIENFITWIPNYGSLKMKSMFKDRLDWCISRQRFWGTPIMLFLDKKNNIHPKSILILKKIKKLIKIYGPDFWYKNDVFNLLNVDKSTYYKTTDVLDVWFDSSSVYSYLINKYKKKIPYDICIEGSDQYRGWFQVSLINATTVFSNTPYKKIISHGFILDNNGRKMSKSLNNVIDPTEIINKYGADVLRLWVSSVNYTIDINISTEIIDRICDSYRKIRNTLRFLISNIYDFNKIDIQSTNNFLKFDLWILYKLYILKADVINDFYNYNFHIAYKKLYNFCITELGSKYMDIVKDRLYTNNLKSKSRKSVQNVFFYIIYNLLKLFSPILSFTTEEVWLNLPFKDTSSIFNSSLNLDIKIISILKKFTIFDLIIWKKIFILKTELNKFFEFIKKNKKINGLLETKITIYCNIYWFMILKKIKNELHFFLQTSESYIRKYKKNHNFKNFFFKINNSKKFKCERCWQRLIKKIKLKICKRCLYNIYYDNYKKS